MSVDWALVFPSLLLEGSSSTNMNGFCVTSLKVRGVNVFKKLTTRLCLGLRVCMSVDWALVFPSLLLKGSSSTNMNGFCVTSLKVSGVNVVWYPASPTLSLESGTSVQWDYTLCCLKMAACVTTPRFTTCYCKYLCS